MESIVQHPEDGSKRWARQGLDRLYRGRDGGVREDGLFGEGSESGKHPSRAVKGPLEGLLRGNLGAAGEWLRGPEEGTYGVRRGADVSCAWRCPSDPALEPAIKRKRLSLSLSLPLSSD